MHGLNLGRIKAQGFWKLPKLVKDRSSSAFCYAPPYYHKSGMGQTWLINLQNSIVVVPC